MNHLVYWIWLSLRCGAGSELGSYLLAHFGTPKAVFEASEKELYAVEGIDRNIAETLLDRDLAYVQKILTYCERNNVGIMTLESELYPERLRAIYAKPLVLYYRGRVPDLDDNLLIACVGTRKCSETGEENAYRLGCDLAEAGAIVVSGMAKGIDSAAQKGALDMGGHTIAVLGCGIDRCYPSENEALMARIAEKGTVITEFAPGTAPNGKNFPIRNRIISGLSRATVVVEADERSGALITAKNAERQGRDVFAYPGGAMDLLSEGTNMLIKNGATLVTSALDILVEYAALYPHRIRTDKLVMVGRKAKMSLKVAAMHDVGEPPRYERKPEAFDAPKKEKKQKRKKPSEEEITASAPKLPKKERELSGLSPEEAAVVRALTAPMTAEALAEKLSSANGMAMSVGELLGLLTMLEIGGHVEALPGGSFGPAEP